MPTSRNDTRVICPFYQYDETASQKRVFRITCEGLVDASTLILNYKFKKDFWIQLETFCCQHYKRCEIYRILMEKYEGGEYGEDGISA